VRLCANTSPQSQRAGRYLPASTAHPAKMAPELARRIVAEYSRPGELVADPMCGIGTTLVEAAALGRRAVGVELEPRWADLARANLARANLARADLARADLAHAGAAGATGSGRVVTGDARQLPELLGRGLTGRVALVVTSPPYGSSVHGQVDARPGQGVVKYDNAYSTDRANLGRVGQQALVAALAEILAGCHQLLRPGGLLVLTARPWRRREQLVDFPGQLTRTAEAGRPGAVRTQRGAAGRPQRRPAGRATIVLPARPGPQGAPARPAAAHHRPRGRAGVPAGLKLRGFTRTEGCSAGTRGPGAPRRGDGPAG